MSSLRKVIAIGAVVILIVFGIVGCGAQKAAQQPTTNTAENPQQKAMELAKLANTGQSAVVQGSPMIGLTMSALDQVGWLAIYTGVLQSVAKENTGLTTFSAQNSAESQMNQIEDFITKGVKAIVLNPVDSAALSAGVEKANKAGIPVVCIDRSTDGGQVAALVESDNTACGRVAADEMAKLANGKTLKVLNIQGDLATSAGLERNQGFLDEAKNLPKLDVVSSLPAYWKAEKANAVVLDAFQAHPDIDAIYIASDNAYAPAVISALKQLNKFSPVGDPKHIILVSVDGGPVMLKYIKDGYADASAAQDLFGMGREALVDAKLAVDGKPIANAKDLIPPTLVTKDNASDSNLWANAFPNES